LLRKKEIMSIIEETSLQEKHEQEREQTREKPRKRRSEPHQLVRKRPQLTRGGRGGTIPSFSSGEEEAHKRGGGGKSDPKFLGKRERREERDRESWHSGSYNGIRRAGGFYGVEKIRMQEKKLIKAPGIVSEGGGGAV